MKSLFFKVVLPVFVIAGILGFITLYNPIQQEHASCGGHPTGPGGNWCEGNQQYTYDNGGIIVYINPQQNSCSSRTTSFSASMNVSGGGTNPGGYTIHWGWLNNFCTAPGQCDNSNSSDTTGMATGSLSGNSSTTATSASLSPSGSFAGLACGDYQADFGFYVIRNRDRANVGGISLGDLNNTNNNATWCNTGNTCNPPTATPTPTNTPTPTSTPTPTNTPTPTVTPGPTATPTPPVDCDGDQDASDPAEDQECAPTSTPTPTVTPTGTITPTQTPTPTMTPVPGEDCDEDFDNSNPSTDCPNATPTTPVVNICTGDSCKVEICTGDSCKVSICTGNSCQPQQQVLGASTPTQLPSTGAESDVLFGLLALVPVAWKIRKLV